MSIKSDAELQGMKAASDAVAIALAEMIKYAAPGMSTKELDDYGKKMLKKYGAISAPMKTYNFPGCTCISVNNEAAHGIPRKNVILKEGDLVNIDVSAVLKGYCGDNGSSFILGNDIHNLQPLVDASQDILMKTIKMLKPGIKLCTIGAFIEKAAKKKGYTTIKNLTGHGIGRQLHEAPHHIPCYNDRFNRKRIQKNAVIALETFISTGARYVDQQNDGWTFKARDGSFVAQHEHTLVVTDKGSVILTKKNGIA